MQFLQCSFVECSLVYLFFSLRAVCSPLGRIYNIATNVSFVSCSFLRCFRCSFPCVFSLVYIVIVFVRCFICSFNHTMSFRSALKIALELVLAPVAVTPSDMKCMSSHLRELNNCATHFPPFANVNQTHKGAMVFNWWP